MQHNTKLFIVLLLSIVLYIFFIFMLANHDANAQIQNWNVNTLKEYTDSKFSAIKEAVEKADAANEKRFESVNEFRATLSDQQRTFVPRSEYEQGHLQLHNDLTDIEARLSKMENTKIGGSNTLYILIAVVSFFFAIFAFVRNYLNINLNKNK